MNTLQPYSYRCCSVGIIRDALLPLLLCLVVTCTVSGQVFAPKSFPVTGHQGQALEHPFSGGLNTPQFSVADVNHDGLQDLYVFDFTGKVSEVYLNSGDKWVYAPGYAAHFPALAYTALLRDFNGDGVMDLFAHSGDTALDGYVVYAGYYDQDTLKFTQLLQGFDPPYLRYMDEMGDAGVLGIVSETYPAINDVDNDGDLDILSINGATGYFEFYQNLSVENGYGQDSLIFTKSTDCYGGAYEDGVGRSLTLASMPGLCAPMRLADPRSNVHGGYSLLSFDNDGDGDDDLLFGDRTFMSMNLLSNGGDNASPHFTSQDTFFPAYNSPVEVSISPVAFYLDTDFDGIRDLVVSSRVVPFGQDSYTLRYKNMGTDSNPDFVLEEEDWLVTASLDYGKLSNVTFTDFNQDSLMDMVVASQDLVINPDSAAEAVLILFENTGTHSAPSFTFVESDWLGLRSLASVWLSPAFADLDDDGDQDLVVGTETGSLSYFENVAGPGQAYDFASPVHGYMGIDVDFNAGLLSAPQIIDLDGDSLKDLVMGVRQGNILFFKNIGVSGSPSFNPDPEASMNVFQLGGLFFGPGGSPQPAFVEEDGELVMYVGVDNGRVHKYSNITGNLTGAFTLEDEHWNNLDVGEFATPAFVDIEQDGYLEIFVGNYRGGINAWGTSIYVDDAVTANHELTAASPMAIYPNPVQDRLQYRVDGRVRQEAIYDLMGKRWHGSPEDVSALPEGVYILVVQTDGSNFVGRFIKG